jgi:hypothetical protein
VRAGLFETHNGGQTYQPAPHSHVHCDKGDGTGHLAKYELVGSMLGVALMQVEEGRGRKRRLCKGIFGSRGSLATCTPTFGDPLAAQTDCSSSFAMHAS